MSSPDPNAYLRIRQIIEALAAASNGDDPAFLMRLATSEELEQLEIALRLRGFWSES